MESNLLILKDQHITLQHISKILTPSYFKYIHSIKILTLNFNGYMSQVRRLQLQYDQSSIGLSPPTIIIKFSKDLPKQNWLYTLLAQTQLQRREVQAYKIWKQNECLKNIIPFLYWQYIDKEQKKFTILMEDLSQNYRIIEQKVGIDNIKQAQMVVKNIAIFHSKFINPEQYRTKFPSFQRYYSTLKTFSSKTQVDEKLVSYLQNKFVENISLMMKILPQLDYTQTKYSGLKNIIAKINLPLLFQYHQHYLSKFLLSKSPIQCIIHGDLRAENILFSQQNIKIIDWQGTSIGNPLIDVLRFLIGSLTIQLRKKSLNSLIDLYIQQFKTNSGVQLENTLIKDWLYIYAIIQMDIISDYTNVLGSTKDIINLKQRICQNGFIQFTLMIVQRLYSFYLDL